MLFDVNKLTCRNCGYISAFSAGNRGNVYLTSINSFAEIADIFPHFPHFPPEIAEILFDVNKFTCGNRGYFSAYSAYSGGNCGNVIRRQYDIKIHLRKSRIFFRIFRVVRRKLRKYFSLTSKVRIRCGYCGKLSAFSALSGGNCGSTFI